MALAAAACCLSAIGCAPGFTRSGPTAVVAPAPNRLYLILTADRSSVRHGESVGFTVQFVNPTAKKVLLPTGTLVEDGVNSIPHQLEVEWQGVDGNSSLGFSGVTIHSSPPTATYLEPKTSRAYRLEWKFEGRGKGTATLVYRFGWSDDFPPAKITLTTR
jgi:hypothetical protein